MGLAMLKTYSVLGDVSPLEPIFCLLESAIQIFMSDIPTCSGVPPNTGSGLANLFDKITELVWMLIDQDPSLNFQVVL